MVEELFLLTYDLNTVIRTIFYWCKSSLLTTKLYYFPFKLGAQKNRLLKLSQH